MKKGRIQRKDVKKGRTEVRKEGRKGYMKEGLYEGRKDYIKEGLH